MSAENAKYVIIMILEPWQCKRFSIGVYLCRDCIL